jgi:hypothetical protein
MRLTEIYVFQCDGGDLYAFSVDKTGCNLPRSACKAGWLLRGQLSSADLCVAEVGELSPCFALERRKIISQE